MPKKKIAKINGQSANNDFAGKIAGMSASATGEISIVVKSKKNGQRNFKLEASASGNGTIAAIAGSAMASGVKVTITTAGDGSIVGLLAGERAKVAKNVKKPKPAKAAIGAQVQAAAVA